MFAPARRRHRVVLCPAVDQAGDLHPLRDSKSDRQAAGSNRMCNRSNCGTGGIAAAASRYATRREVALVEHKPRRSLPAIAESRVIGPPRGRRDALNIAACEQGLRSNRVGERRKAILDTAGAIWRST